MILQLKRDGEIGYLIEEQLAKNFENVPPPQFSKSPMR